MALLSGSDFLNASGSRDLSMSGQLDERVTASAQTSSVDAARAVLTEPAASGKILVLWPGPSLSYLAAIHEAFLALVIP